MRSIAASLCALVVLLAGCGGGDDEQARVRIDVDNTVRGDPQLTGGPARDRQQQRVAITPQGVPTALYAVPLDDLDDGTRLRAVSVVTVTKCQHTDYRPKQRDFTGCEYTKRYTFNPVAVETQFRAVPDANGAPDLSATGVPVGAPRKVDCDNLRHHCTVLNLGEAELDSDAAAEDPAWVVLEVTARSPRASACEPRRASDCEVLAVEVQKGTVMYVADVHGDVPQPEKVPRDATEETRSLRVVNDITEGTARGSGREVVYSIPLAGKGKVGELEGDQLEVGALLRVASETRQYAPLVTSFFVLSDSAKGTTGRYLESDSYSSARTGNAGENCSGRCSYLRGSVATTILPCDVKAGRRFVNLVAGADRDIAPPGRHVAILEGGMRIVRYYDSKYSEGSGGSC